MINYCMITKYKWGALIPTYMIQWLLKSVLYVMGLVYVVIDNFVTYPTDKILGMDIDEDLQKLDRKQLCTFLELKYGLSDGEVWSLPSTSKIRLGCQLGLLSSKKNDN